MSLITEAELLLPQGAAVTERRYWTSVRSLGDTRQLTCYRAADGSTFIYTQTKERHFKTQRNTLTPNVRVRKLGRNESRATQVDDPGDNRK